MQTRTFPLKRNGLTLKNIMLLETRRICCHLALTLLLRLKRREGRKGPEQRTSSSGQDYTLRYACSNDIEADRLLDRGLFVTAQTANERRLFDGDLPVRPIHPLLSAHRFLALITSLYSCYTAQRDVCCDFFHQAMRCGLLFLEFLYRQNVFYCVLRSVFFLLL